MKPLATETIYRNYIHHLNERRLDLSEFVHDKLSYNGEPMTRADYQNMIAKDIEAVPDLYFEINMLVVDDDQVACRINFNCTPRGEFMGFRPNGKKISFSEHVFYKLREGKIYEVLSLIDKPAIQSQMS